MQFKKSKLFPEHVYLGMPIGILYYCTKGLQYYVPILFTSVSNTRRTFRRRGVIVKTCLHSWKLPSG